MECLNGFSISAIQCHLLTVDIWDRPLSRVDPFHDGPVKACRPLTANSGQIAQAAAVAAGQFTTYKLQV